MNIIKFEAENHKSENGHQYRTVNILIDDDKLSDLIKVIELPMAKKEGSPSIAGGYDAIGLPSNPEQYFLGLEQANNGEDENKTVLLDCECGCSGCWPLLCKIDSEKEAVVWSAFEQPHRLSDSPASHWDYSEYEGFKFNKAQYLQALSGISNN